MRRSLPIILIILLLAAGGVAWYLTRPRTSTTQPINSVTSSPATNSATTIDENDNLDEALSDLEDVGSLTQ